MNALITTSLAGRLLKPDGSPQPGVTVNLLNSDGEVIAAYVTGADGEYKFNLMESGHYSIQPPVANARPPKVCFDVIVPGATFAIG